MQEDGASSDWTEEEAVIDSSDEELQDIETGHTFESSPRSTSFGRRNSSGHSRRSVADPLLWRHDSTRTETSYWGRGGRSNQRIYIVTEDLTIVVSGFNNSLFGYASYLALCIFTCGLAYLILRWLPRWRVRLVGEHKTLRDCSWVVVEVRCPVRENPTPVLIP